MPSPVPCSLRREFVTVDEYQRYSLSSQLETDFDKNDAIARDDSSNDSVATSSTFTESVSTETARQVRFAESKHGKVKCQKFGSCEPLTPNEVTDAWYTTDELGELRANCRQESISSYQTEYRSHYMRLYHSCDDTTKQSDNHLHLLKDGAASAVAVAHSEFRGYERGLYHGSMRRSRKECVSNVIDAQDDCWENNDLSVEELSQHLASICQQLTKRSRRIAFFVGMGDSIAAETVNAQR